MTPLSGVCRAIAKSMVILAVSVAGIAIVGTVLFYYVWWKLDSKAIAQEMMPDRLTSLVDWIPSSRPELLWNVLLILCALLLALLLAARLSKRLLVPLNSVTTCLHAIAGGQFSERAQASPLAMKEAARLVRDVNLMADRLEQMAAEKARWTATVSHELRTPVTILRGRLQGLTEGVFAPDEELFRGLLSHVEGLSRLIEDLRIVSLNENDQLFLQKENSRLGEQLKLLMHSMAHEFEQKGFSLEAQLTTETVCCDTQRMQQALVSLLDNVLKHAAPGRVRVELTVGDDGRARLSVEDSGPGVPDAQVLQLFQIFSRGETSARGSGLGLSVVRAIAVAHAGSVGYCGTPAGGARFELEWPAARQVED